jgi:hypothetical protein
MSFDPRAWRRYDARAWAEAQCTPATAPRRGGRLRKGHGATLAEMGAAWAIFALGVTSIALAQGGGGGNNPSANAARGEGDPIDLARRNPRKGAANKETAVVTKKGNGGLAIRPSNTAKGGRAISATCNNDGTAAEDGCAVYVNKGTGPTASFRSAGSVPFVIRDTNTGRVENLNADYLDNFHASQLISAARSKTGLDADTVDGKSASDFVPTGKVLTSGSLVEADPSEYVTLVDNDGLKLRLLCDDNGGGNFTVWLAWETNEAGSQAGYQNGTPTPGSALEPGTQVQQIVIGGGTTAAYVGGIAFSAAAPSGKTLDGTASVGRKVLGNPDGCVGQAMSAG